LCAVSFVTSAACNNNFRAESMAKVARVNEKRSTRETRTVPVYLLNGQEICHVPVSDDGTSDLAVNLHHKVREFGLEPSDYRLLLNAQSAEEAVVHQPPKKRKTDVQKVSASSSSSNEGPTSECEDETDQPEFIQLIVNTPALDARTKRYVQLCCREDPPRENPFAAKFWGRNLAEDEYVVKRLLTANPAWLRLFEEPARDLVVVAAAADAAVALELFPHYRSDRQFLEDVLKHISITWSCLPSSWASDLFPVKKSRLPKVTSLDVFKRRWKTTSDVLQITEEYAVREGDKAPYEKCVEERELLAFSAMTRDVRAQCRFSLLKYFRFDMVAFLRSWEPSWIDERLFQELQGMKYYEAFPLKLLEVICEVFPADFLVEDKTRMLSILHSIPRPNHHRALDSLNRLCVTYQPSDVEMIRKFFAAYPREPPICALPRAVLEERAKLELMVSEFPCGVIGLLASESNADAALVDQDLFDIVSERGEFWERLVTKSRARKKILERGFVVPEQKKIDALVQGHKELYSPFLGWTEEYKKYKEYSESRK